MILKAEELTPIRFYPYTSRVRERIYRTDSNEFTRQFKQELIDRFVEAGIKAYDDNKIVFEVETEDEYTLCFGFYDGRFSIGLSAETDDF